MENNINHYEIDFSGITSTCEFVKEIYEKLVAKIKAICDERKAHTIVAGKAVGSILAGSYSDGVKPRHFCVAKMLP